MTLQTRLKSECLKYAASCVGVNVEQEKYTNDIENDCCNNSYGKELRINFIYISKVSSIRGSEKLGKSIYFLSFIHSFISFSLLINFFPVQLFSFVVLYFCLDLFRFTLIILFHSFSSFKFYFLRLQLNRHQVMPFQS